MNKCLLVSVKTMTYNQESYIAQAIEGVPMQKTDFPIAPVIGEDCTTDGTRGIVMEYQKKQPEIIRVITSEHNVGMMGNGLRTDKACREGYVAYCEGDERSGNPLKIVTQVGFMGAKPDSVGSFTSGGILNEMHHGARIPCCQGLAKHESVLGDLSQRRRWLTCPIAWTRILIPWHS